MAGVIAHSRATVSSANARVLVTLVIVLLLTTLNKVLAAKDNVIPAWTGAAVTPVTALSEGFLA